MLLEFVAPQNGRSEERRVGKEESEKVVLKLNIQKTKIMAFGPISSWQIDGETKETGTDFIKTTWQEATSP